MNSNRAYQLVSCELQYQLVRGNRTKERKIGTNSHLHILEYNLEFCETKSIC